MVSELADHRGDLIVYLNRVSSDFLLYVIPNLERELLSRDASRRTETISVIGRIFTDEESSAVRDYGALLRRFATRMSDIEPSIRRQTCTFVTSIVQKHPQTSEELFPRLEVRLLDGEVEVSITVSIPTKIHPLDGENRETKTIIKTDQSSEYLYSSLVPEYTVFFPPRTGKEIERS